MKKKRKIKKSQKQLEIKKRTTFLLFLCGMIVLLGYYILISDSLKPKVNELTASYISLNNHNTTDMLKISNIEKMNLTKGKSNRNKKMISFDISGEKGANYQIIIQPISNTIDEKNIYYSISINNRIIYDTLNHAKLENKNERIIYQGKDNKNTKVIIRMWIDNHYSGKVKNNSFEIKVKTTK